MRALLLSLALLPAAVAAAEDDPEPPDPRPTLPEGHRRIVGTVFSLTGGGKRPMGTRGWVRPPEISIHYTQGGTKRAMHLYLTPHVAGGKPRPGSGRVYRRYYKHAMKDVKVGDTVELTYSDGAPYGTSYQDWVEGLRVVKKGEKKAKD